MRAFETQAFVLRRFPSTGKQDIRTSLFTQTYGKLYVTAKGAQSIRSKRVGVLDTGNIIQCAFSEHSTGMYMKSVDLVSRMTNIKGTIEKATMLLLAFDVLDTLLPLEQPEEQVYEGLKQYVCDLDTTENPRELTIVWMQKIIELLGYPPVRKSETIAQMLVKVEELLERSFAAPWQFIVK